MRWITRSEWGARAPKDPPTQISTPAPYVVLHHAAAGAWAGAAAVRGHQNFHMDPPPRGRDWDDIAYNALAGTDAVYEGRGWGIMSAATSPVNSRSQAVCALGDWSETEPPDALLTNLAYAVVWAWRAGAVLRPAYTGGHRDYADRDCPGDRLYAKIPEINRRAAAIVAGKVPEEVPNMFCNTNTPAPSRVVKVWQRRLRRMGLYEGEIDGDYGPQTTAAVLAALRNAFPNTSLTGEAINAFAADVLEVMHSTFLSNRNLRRKGLLGGDPEDDLRLTEEDIAMLDERYVEHGEQVKMGDDE